jgi:hypothetical protein
MGKVHRPIWIQPYFHQQGIMGKKKNKNEPEPRDPCEELPDGKCKCRQRWCKDKGEGSCGNCRRHCICIAKKYVYAARPKPEKAECEKVANATVSSRPQRERQAVMYVEPDSDVDDETIPGSKSAL